MEKLAQTIFHRHSVRKFSPQPLDEETLQKIEQVIPTLKPLYPDIKVKFSIVERNKIRTLMPWSSPHYLAVFSEEKSGFWENAGFIFAQLDLYLQSNGIGCCWLGLGKPNKDFEKPEGEWRFVIMLAIGLPESKMRGGAEHFKRKKLEDISDILDTRLEPVRLAPSSINSQPWYFTHNGNELRAFMPSRKPLGLKTLENMNRIDMGIALAHAFVSHPDAFNFYNENPAPALKGYDYIGTFKI